METGFDVIGAADLHDPRPLLNLTKEFYRSGMTPGIDTNNLA